jgi:hypothetical protein
MLRLLESIHGSLGVLAVVALVHPAILLRRGKPLTRGVRLSVWLTTAACALAFALGVGIYGDYRALVKVELFRASARAGFLFETKEHLAFATIALALTAGAAALVAPRDAVAVRRLSAVLYATAAVLGLVVASLGTYVQSIRGF